MVATDPRKRQTVEALIAQAFRELKAPDPEEITQKHDLEELKKEVRQKLPSVPEIHIHQDKPDSTPAELKIAWKHRGLVVRLLPYLGVLGAGAVAERVLRLVGVIK